MGADQSIGKSPSYSPQRNAKKLEPMKTSPTKQSNRVFTQMAKKVLDSKEEMYLEHHKNVKDNYSTFVNSDLNQELYYDFLSKTDSFSAYCSTKGPGDTFGPDSFFTVKGSQRRPKVEVKNEHKRTSSIRHSPVKNNPLKLSMDYFQSGRSVAQTLVPKIIMSSTVRSKSNSREAKVKRREQPKQKMENCAAPEANKSDTGINEHLPVKYEKAIILKQIPEERQQRFDKISLLPWNIFIKILSYGINDFRCYLSVNPSWYFSTLTAFDNFFNQLENEFVTMYSDYLLFKDSYTSSSKIAFCSKQGIRIDRVLKCENLPSTSSKTLTIAYTFKYCNEPANVYKNEFTFDSVAKAPRCVWIHKNECLVYLLFIIPHYSSTQMMLLEQIHNLYHQFA